MNCNLTKLLSQKPVLHTFYIVYFAMSMHRNLFQERLLQCHIDVFCLKRLVLVLKLLLLFVCFDKVKTYNYYNIFKGLGVVVLTLYVDEWISIKLPQFTWLPVKLQSLLICIEVQILFEHGAILVSLDIIFLRVHSADGNIWCIPSSNRSVDSFRTECVSC